MTNTLTYLVLELLQKNNILIDSQELNFQIQSHPSYPSLHSITGVLSHFNIENVAIRVPVNSETLSELPKCFLAEIEIDDIKHLVLVNKTGRDYKLVFDKKNNKIISETLFLEQFTGVIVVVENDKTKSTSKTIKSDYTKLLAYVTAVLFILVFFFLKPNLIVSVHYLLSILGVATSILIIQHDLGMSSTIVNSICSQESKTTNCNAVLNSKGAQLFNAIKLRDVCIIYFSAISVSWFLLLLSKTGYSIVFGFSILAIPAIIYSIYYQAVITKAWCILCLTVVVILVSQVMLALFAGLPQMDFSKLHLSSLIILVSIVSISAFWLFIASKLEKEKNYNILKIEATKFKRNYSIFKNLLYEHKPIDTRVTNASEIVFGNKKSSLKLLVITNPFCGFCKDVHLLVENLLRKYSDQISITIRFNINTQNSESELVRTTSRLLEIYNMEEEQTCLKAMHDIYVKKDFQEWIKLFGDCENPLQYQEVLSKEREWCLKNQINFTPELLINGVVYPKVYKKEDLWYFIDELYEDDLDSFTEVLKLETV